MGIFKQLAIIIGCLAVGELIVWLTHVPVPSSILGMLLLTALLLLNVTAGCLAEETDYKAIKYAEGVLTDEDYQATGIQRQAWRRRINELEALIGG